MPALILVLIRFIRSIGRGLRDPEFRGLFGWVVILLLTGMLFYRQYEGWSWLDSLYFTVITLTTVGYGDFAPQTSAGKIFTIIYIVLGLGALSSFIILLAERQQPDGASFLSKIRERRGKRPSDSTESSAEDKT